jgi:hypothetical protein
MSNIAEGFGVCTMFTLVKTMWRIAALRLFWPQRPTLHFEQTPLFTQTPPASLVDLVYGNRIQAHMALI